MKEVSITMWELKPEEAIQLPKGTHILEYDPLTQRIRLKRADFCLYDRTCIYLLPKDPAETSQKSPKTGTK